MATLGIICRYFSLTPAIFRQVSHLNVSFIRPLTSAVVIHTEPGLIYKNLIKPIKRRWMASRLFSHALEYVSDGLPGAVFKRVYLGHDVMRILTVEVFWHQ